MESRPSSARCEGKILGIAIRARSRSPMIELEQAEITTAEGIAGDFRGKPGGRQVTLMSREAWQTACEQLGQDLPWTTRRANLLVEGLDFADTARRVIRIGDVELTVTCETDPCHRMEEAAKGLMGALAPDWRGGVCCRVIVGGAIRRGDQVTLDPA